MGSKQKGGEAAHALSSIYLFFALDIKLNRYKTHAVKSLSRIPVPSRLCPSVTQHFLIVTVCSDTHTSELA